MIRILSRSVREYKTTSILSILFVVLEVIMECFVPFVMSSLIDEMNGGEMKIVLQYSVVLVVMTLLSLLFGILSGRFCAKASAGYAKNLRQDVYESISKYSFANIDHFSSASLVTRMTTDVTNVQNAFMMIIRVAFRAPLMLVFSIVMAFIVGPSLAWIFVIIVPIIAILLLASIYKALPIFNEAFKKYDAFNESIQENISAIRVVKSYVREDYEIKKVTKTSEDVRDSFLKSEKIVALNTPIMQFAIYTLNLVVIFVGAILIINSAKIEGDEIIWNGLSTGNLSALLSYGMQSLMSLMMLAMILVMISIAMASAKRIVEVLQEVSDITNPNNPIYEVEDGSIEFENVSFKYKADSDDYALKNVNLKIESGQSIGIIGGTGASKTTLIQLISRLYDATEGSVLVGGKRVQDYDLKTLRNQVSVVLQKNLLFSGTIKENLKWGNKDATDEEIIEAAKLAQADSFVQSFPNQYDTHIEQGGTNVSGGQKQRLCIARALLKKPKILILDDSTSAVDTKTDSMIRTAFKEKLPNITKIIIAQRISSISDSDQIIVMDNGEINAVGNHDYLLANNQIYQEVYYSQNKIGGGIGE